MSRRSTRSPATGERQPEVRHRDSSSTTALASAFRCAKERGPSGNTASISSSSKVWCRPAITSRSSSRFTDALIRGSGRGILCVLVTASGRARARPLDRTAQLHGARIDGYQPERGLLADAGRDGGAVGRDASHCLSDRRHRLLQLVDQFGERVTKDLVTAHRLAPHHHAEDRGDQGLVFTQGLRLAPLHRRAEESGRRGCHRSLLRELRLPVVAGRGERWLTSQRHLQVTLLPRHAPDLSTTSRSQ